MRGRAAPPHPRIYRVPPSPPWGLSTISKTSARVSSGFQTRGFIVFGRLETWWNPKHEFLKWLLQRNYTNFGRVVFFPFFFKMPCMCDLLYSVGIHCICELLFLISNSFALHQICIPKALWTWSDLHIAFAMAEGRFRFPKTIEEEELCVERAVPKSTRYKKKWTLGIFEGWQWVRSVKYPIVEVGAGFKDYELDKVQPLTRPITEINALTPSSRGSTIGYPNLFKRWQNVPKIHTLRKRCTRLLAAFADSWWKRTQPSSSIPWTLQTKGGEGRGERGPFNILKLKEIASSFSLFLIGFAIFRRILDAEMKDGTRAGVG